MEVMSEAEKEYNWVFKRIIGTTNQPKKKHAVFFSVESVVDDLIMNSPLSVFPEFLFWYAAFLFPHCQVSIHYTKQTKNELHTEFLKN